MKKLPLILTLALTLAVPLTGCNQEASHYDREFFAFDSYFAIRLYDGNESNLDDLETLVTYLSKLSDSYKEYDGITNVYSINHSSSALVVDPSLFSLLKKAESLESETEGYIYPLIGELSELWKSSLEADKVPSEEAIATSISHFSTSSLTLENSTVTRSGLAQIDLGAIAKGYALDCCYDYLTSKGIKQYLINGGSSAILLGEKPSGDGTFSVAISDLSGKYLTLKNCALATSSVYEQLYTIDGSDYSHIISPFSGSAQVSSLASPLAIVVGSNATELDALSTYFTLVGESKASSFESQGLSLILGSKENGLSYHSSTLEVKNRS